MILSANVTHDVKSSAHFNRSTQMKSVHFILLLFQKHLKTWKWSTVRLSRLIFDVSNFLKILVTQRHPRFLKNVGHPSFLKCGLAPDHGNHPGLPDGQNHRTSRL